ncbi:septum formation initiator family protein [Paenibacillus albus]|uniref:septum formation initiator family protein n=1 Tax=Paenibacillus albus TaxID=2495582 RepID=UPI001D1323BF|nr:septum formation initiator family protein [Paenibacillus albus]
MNGNLALQPKRKTDPKQQPQFRETKKVVVRRKSLPVQEKLLYMFTILVCVVVAGVIIFRYAQIYQMELQIKQLTKQHDELVVDMADLKAQYEKLNDPQKVQEFAKDNDMTASTPIFVSPKTDTPLASAKK